MICRMSRAQASPIYYLFRLGFILQSNLLEDLRQGVREIIDLEINNQVAISLTQWHSVLASLTVVCI
jgi:hypothetical protein